VPRECNGSVINGAVPLPAFINSDIASISSAPRCTYAPRATLYLTFCYFTRNLEISSRGIRAEFLARELRVLDGRPTISGAGHVYKIARINIRHGVAFDILNNFARERVIHAERYKTEMTRVYPDAKARRDETRFRDPRVPRQRIFSE